MADIIEKIGKYFADQEAQMRDMYVHAAAHAVSASAPAKSAAPQPPPRGESAVGKTRGGRAPGGNEAVHTEQKATSLLRRRLSLTKNDAVDSVPGAESVAEAVVGRRDARSSSREKTRGGTAVRDFESSASEEGGSMVSWGVTAPASSLSARSVDTSVSSLTSKEAGGVKKKKKNKKSSKTTKGDEELEREKAQQRAAEGFARAQERARRIQMERAMQEKQQQLEREANAARLAEEMRKIEEIRRKGKQFALRLRPQSAPTSPRSRTPQQQQQQHQPSDDRPASARSELLDHHPAPVGPIPKRSYLDYLEHEMRDQVEAEMKLYQTIDDIRSREEEDWNRLQAQIKKATDRNAIKQERINSMMKSKEEMLKEIGENQAEAAALRHERHQLEEKSKRERMNRQREAEREIHARLRREESQRLVDEERAQSDHAAEARAKAKMRVQSRAALLKRVLHGCDIRSNTNASRNQDDEDKSRDEKPGKSPAVIEVVPELAEFEEDGLVGPGDLPAFISAPVSPKKTIWPLILQASNSIEPSFNWQVPALSMGEIHRILHDAYDDLLDSA